MGKKLSINQASTKISKEDRKKQQQLNTMIKILDQSPSGAGKIIIPENLNSMLLLDGRSLQDNNMEQHYPAHNDDLVSSLSPPSSPSSCDWQLEMMDPLFTSYNFCDFDDACYNNFNIPKEQALYHQQEVCIFENIELLHW
ncbi:hypothetical protein LIER_38792 [Lithospermum erythrorhizon]|uniref:Uncharacterized protein n=1 Tax=Lithospermum erythrorhizon TaxID=34254 RepID=A0AAV3Q7G3_LITER